ncbi:outer membrane protein assembly factor BamE [Hydrogenophaga sp.]|uniref:outer membrane protein assembly factor BamE n=1 Tax=Hydrogenophaga sp. TaxID=1904254 RepID=UPI0025C0EF47|nr:outer membrane protein assembly factor BamE [Hydrogenophaga sp.]
MQSFSDCREFLRRAQPARRVACGLTVTVALASLAGCAGLRDKLPDVPSFASLVTPYKIDIQQGNVVTREQAQALQPGMSRLQVRDILGSPLLASVFHADRWDYVFTFRRQGQPLQQRKLAVFFKGEVMERIESDELPSEAEFVASLDARRQFEKVPPLVATEEQLKAFQERNKVTAPAATPATPSTTNYPPLEPAQ